MSAVSTHLRALFSDVWRRGLCGLSAWILVACGNNTPELPPGLADALRDAGGNPRDYPAGPYGSEIGETAPNSCFTQVWQDPLGAGFDPAELKSICFDAFYDPDGARGVRLVLVNTAAIWCAPCKLEWGGAGDWESLSAEQGARANRGFRVLGLLFEEADGSPATATSAKLWAESYGVTVPFGIDPDFVMGAFASRNLQPFNLLIDARDMRIVQKITGYQPEVLFAAVDAELERRRRAAP